MNQLGRLQQEPEHLWIPPILLPVIAFIVGIVVEENGPNLVWLPCLCLPIGLLGHLRPWRILSKVPVFLLALAFSAGIFRAYVYNHLWASDDIRMFVPADSIDRVPVKVRLTGWVSTPATISQTPKTFPYHSRPNLKTRFLVDTRQIRLGGTTYPTSGQVEISLPGMVDRYQPGQELQLLGRLTSTHIRASDFPFPNRYRYYEHNRIFARLQVQSTEDISILSRKCSPWTSALAKGRQTARALLLGNEPPTGEYTTGLLGAFILGDRYRMQNDLNEAMVNIGASHLLAVSGFNLAVLAGGVWALCAIVGLSRRSSTFVVILATLVYALLTDLQPSVVRATIMIVLFSVGTLLNKQTNALNSLSLAALIILLVNPNQLFGPGFQLSFVSTLSVLTLTGPLRQYLFSPRFPTPADQMSDQRPSTSRVARSLIIDHIKLLIAASIAAGVGTLPLVLSHFKMVSLMGSVSSVVLFLPATVLTLVGYAQLIFTMFVPPLGSVLAVATDYISSGFSALALLLSRIPGTCFDAPPPAWYLILGYFLAVFYSFLRSGRPFKHWRVQGLLLLTVAIVYFTTWILTGPAKGPWVFVSQDPEGQAVIINDGRSLALINAGTAREGKLEELTRQIACRFVAEPCLAVLTSPQPRYFSELLPMSRRYPNLRIFLPPTFADERTARYEPIELLLNSNLPKETITAGTEINTGRATIRLLFPPKDLQSIPAASDPSGVVLVDLTTMKLLVGSQLTAFASGCIRRNHPGLKTDVVVLDANAERGESLEHFLACLQPKKVIVTSWLRPKTLQWYRDAAVKLDFQLILAPETGGVLLTDQDLR